MVNVITFGSATWDIFIRDKELQFKKNKNFVTEKGVYFPLGAKIDIDEINFSSGGGGTNAAATFSSQGIKTFYCGMIGSDPGGEEIIKVLNSLKVDTSLISKTNNKFTNHSFVLSIPKKDRTILTYRGASEFMTYDDIPLSQLKRKTSNKSWFYLAPMNGRLSKTFEKIVDFGHSNNIKIALNPGISQLKLPKKKLIKILKKTDILILNREEASILTGISYKKDKEIFEKIKFFYPGIFAITNGSQGAIVSDGVKKYSVGILKSKVVDRTGAGDSFSAGFVSGIIKGKDITYSIQLASANATSCLREWGAKNGLLSAGQKFKKIKVIKSDA